MSDSPQTPPDKPSNHSTKIKLPASVDPNPEFVILPLIQATAEDSKIDVEKIQHLCSCGLDSSRPEDRAVAWLVLSHIFKTDPFSVPQIRSKNKESYLEYIKILNMEGYENEIFPLDAEVTKFREGIDNELMSLIYIDVLRTPHHIHFLPFQDTSVEITSTTDNLAPFHQQMRRIERILYIFAKLNSTVSYLQGMNEIATVLYYVFSMAIAFFSNDHDEMESFVFTMFQTLHGSTKLSEMYLLQERSTILQSRMNQFMDVLGKHFPKGANIITTHNIPPFVFCYKWLLCLFSQDYLIPKLVLVWDALFAHFDELLEYATYVAVAKVKLLENELDLEDYIKSMTTLNKGVAENVEELLRVADRYWLEDHSEKNQLLTKVTNFFKNIQILPKQQNHQDKKQPPPPNDHSPNHKK
ncbi:hypothetical protein M9Y10_015131 [Tritrichomonas musculus]|uniref:Rab-GAP TBC domain-containing protein n=1 Tax=Tritrichomonas musculus TaxID=1915356 RepID=A0ABR2L1E8_9EUKA